MRQVLIFSIQEQKLSQITPNDDFDVIIYVVEDSLDAQFLYDTVDDYNRNYPDYKFIPDHGKTKTYIQGIQTSNGKYNLVLCQSRNELTEARKKLAKNQLLRLLGKKLSKRSVRGRLWNHQRLKKSTLRRNIGKEKFLMSYLKNIYRSMVMNILLDGV